MSDPEKPCYDLPRLSSEQSLESMELFNALVPVSEALAPLSATAEESPNQAALHQSVILLKAKASPEIELIITTAAKLFESDSSQKVPADMRLALAAQIIFQFEYFANFKTNCNFVRP